MSKPNILIFYTDDHAQWASRAYGNSEIACPTMDRLAATGARMADAFTPLPVCSPARASFWTGKIPSAHGVHDYIDELGAGAGHPGIAGQTHLAERLKRLGYRTGLAGKWHLNNFRGPPDGFDDWFTLAEGTNARFGRQPFYDGDRLVELHGHQAVFITDRAVRFIRDAVEDEAPWMLFVGYTNTHTPHVQEPERLVAPYRDKATFEDIPDETFAECHGFARFPYEHAPTTHREELAQYYAAVSMIDEQMGRVVDVLESLGQLEETLLVYTADHGHMNGHHGLHTKGNATIPQNLLEESIRVPALVSWPGVIEPGRVHEAPVDHCDLFATVLDAAGADVEGECEDAGSPGVSYLSTLRGEDQPWRRIQFSEYGNTRMARTGAAKLIRRWPGPNGHFRDEFYDLAADPRERINAIDDPAHAAAVADLSERIDTYFARWEDPAKTGTRIADQPRCSNWMPWEATPEQVLAHRGA